MMTIPLYQLFKKSQSYSAHPGHLDLIALKVEEKLTGKEEVVFSADEVANSA